MRHKLTMLAPSGQAAPQVVVTDERLPTSYADTDTQFRLEATTSGQLQSYLINVMHARDASGADHAVTMTEDETSFTITIQSDGGRTAVAKVVKGMASTGGALGYADHGNPAVVSLTDGVMPISVTTDGVSWGGEPLPPDPEPPLPVDEWAEEYRWVVSETATQRKTEVFERKKERK